MSELMFLLFFFFKQKTAYEMRISDWSSDVCSSDLPGRGTDGGVARRNRRDRLSDRLGQPRPLHRAPPGGQPRDAAVDPGRLCAAADHLGDRSHFPRPSAAGADPRSEEHTSELQSLMRISYAVFCLKKKKQHKPQLHQTTPNRLP